MPSLEQLNFDNSFARLGGQFYTWVQPQGFTNPHLVTANPDAAALIRLDPDEIERLEFLQWISGNWQAPGSQPLAMVYSGHQFGGYSPQLGDGRGLLLGEVNGWDIHLKGAGKTPYSRFGDGRAVLRSCIREYLCSEALHGLGIPTTRALAIAGSDEPVPRETVETGAMLVRLARSHVRFGSFEYFYHSNQHDALQQLADYVIERHLPAAIETKAPYADLFHHAVSNTAKLIAQWQAVGFSHGVMNTDNMSILGETLDFGPYGFMEAYQPDFICNHSDHSGRYAFNRQPLIGLWNCNALAHALSPLVPVATLKSILEEFEPLYLETLLQLQRRKLGLNLEKPEDQVLVNDLLALMAEDRVDYSIFFRQLCFFDIKFDNSALRNLFINWSGFDAWARRYQERLNQEKTPPLERQQQMLHANPKYILRNYMAETAIQKARDNEDFSEIERLRQLLAAPYDEQPEMAQYANLPPDWATHISVSCSS